VESNDHLVAVLEALQNFRKPVMAGKPVSHPEVIRQVKLPSRTLAPLAF